MVKKECPGKLLRRWDQFKADIHSAYRQQKHKKNSSGRKLEPQSPHFQTEIVKYSIRHFKSNHALNKRPASHSRAKSLIFPLFLYRQRGKKQWG